MHRLDLPRPLSRAPRLAVLALALLALGACMDDAPTTQGPSSHLRVINAVPNGPVVDLFVDSARVVTGIGYRSMTGFLRVAAGDRRIRLMSTGTTTPVLDHSMPIEFPRAYTLISTGLAAGVQPLVAADTAPIPLNGEFKLRVIQAAPAGGLVDLYVTDPNALLTGTTPTMEDLPFRGNSEYFAFPVGRWRIRLTAAGTTNVLLDLTQLFSERAMRTVVVTDAGGGGTPLVGLFLVDY